VVIASVATAQAVDQLEKKSKGNVKALVLNPKEVSYLTPCYTIGQYQLVLALLCSVLPPVLERRFVSKVPFKHSRRSLPSIRLIALFYFTYIQYPGFLHLVTFTFHLGNPDSTRTSGSLLGIYATYVRSSPHTARCYPRSSSSFPYFVKQTRIREVQGVYN